MKTYSKLQTGEIEKFSLKSRTRQRDLLPSLIFSIDHRAGDLGWCSERERETEQEEKKESKKEGGREGKKREKRYEDWKEGKSVIVHR